jgi:methionyl-tRNA formyltransferase
MRIVFAGSPAFAVPSLESLLSSKHQVVAVVTQPARPSGRGLVLADPPVRLFADERGLAVFQPQRFNAPSFLDTLAAMEPDLIVTAAYGRIFGRRALTLPKRGCVNLHASLLPKYRGVAPVNWAIINGESSTGVTAFFMEEGVDTGDIILSRSTDIGCDETAGVLLDRLALLGAELLTETCDLVDSGCASRTKQDEGRASYAPKLAKQDGRIPWERDARSVHNLVRGVSPWPGAFCLLEGVPLKVLGTRLAEYEPGESGAARCAGNGVPEAGSESPGEGAAAPGALMEIDAKKGLRVSCGSGSVWLVTVQAQGKRPTAGADFARGRRIKVGDRVG